MELEGDELVAGTDSNDDVVGEDSGHDNLDAEGKEPVADTEYREAIQVAVLHGGILESKDGFHRVDRRDDVQEVDSAVDSEREAGHKVHGDKLVGTFEDVQGGFVVYPRYKQSVAHSLDLGLTRCCGHSYCSLP